MAADFAWSGREGCFFVDWERSWEKVGGPERLACARAAVKIDSLKMRPGDQIGKPMNFPFRNSGVAIVGGMVHLPAAMLKLLLAVAGILTTAAFDARGADVVFQLPRGVERPWPGPELWTNPAEDWMLRSGRLENTMSGGNRNVVALTAELTAEPKPFTIRCRLDQIGEASVIPGFVGFQVGLQAPSGDFREAAVSGTGLCVGVKTDGTPFINQTMGDVEKVAVPFRNLVLELTGIPGPDNSYQLQLVATQGGLSVTTYSVQATVHASWLTGLVAFTSSTAMPPVIDAAAPRPAAGVPELGQERMGNALLAGFDQMAISGGKVAHHPERAFGPIYWVTHTLSNDGSVRLLVQAAPFGAREDHEVTLALNGSQHSKKLLDRASRTARFVLRRMAVDRPHPYTVELAGATFKGTVQPVPRGKATVAALSCNDGTGFPHNDLVANVSAHQPDLIAFLGDQIYEAVGGYGVVLDQYPNQRTVVCYLRKYAMHGWVWRDILRNTPSVTIPDDHDVFHGNLWGESGKKADVTGGFFASAQDSGGYKMHPDFVNAVHVSQTGNLPAPIDPAPVNSDISVYFTRLQFGPLDLAIIADRQFKSAPAPLLPEGKIENGWPKSPNFYLTPPPDHPRAELLGERQEAFLKRWAAKPEAATPIRMVLSQTPWTAAHTLPANVQSDADIPSVPILKPGEYPPNDQAKPDFGTNGWPQGKRNLALDLMKTAGAMHLTGDQHLGSTGQYGIKSFRDGPWWVSTPAIANTWPRRWMPAVKGANPRPGDPRETGDFTDAFGNKLTMAAVANPFQTGRQPARLFDRAVGYTILSCDSASGQVTIANWPYWASPERPEPDNKPYPGWPITINPKTRTRL